ncbi:MAG TPA: DUF2182 domain-containing protein [Stellaceae bacterium]|jgi:hypothetical protein
MGRISLTSPSVRRKLILLVLLAVVAGSCWALLLAPAQRAGSGMAIASPTMGLSAAAFLAIWVVMMVAMMFPAAAPMILAFHRIGSGKRAATPSPRPGCPSLDTW